MKYNIGGKVITSFTSCRFASKERTKDKIFNLFSRPLMRSNYANVCMYIYRYILKELESRRKIERKEEERSD